MKTKNEKQKTKSQNLKLKILGITFLMLLTFTACAKQEAENIPAQTIEVAKDTPLVYLKVEGAVASSFDETPDWAPKPDAMAPVDRDMLTRWSPKLGVDDQWIYFDFGKPKVLSKIIIRWEQAYAVDYEILTSLDANKWRRLVLMKDQDGAIDEIEFPPVKARYVKIIGLKRSNPSWGFSMWEFEIYGPKSLNPGEKEEKRDFEDIEKKKKAFEEAIAELKTEPQPLTPEEFHKGVVYTSWSDAELASVASDLMLVYLKKVGVEHIAIMIPTYQEQVDSTEILTHDFEGGDTPTDEAIIHAVKTCHLLGMKVMLKPHVDCLDGTFRGDIIASPEWFESYKKMILRYAKLAENNNVEMFSVGTELENTTFSRWQKEWEDIINSVREIYKGYIVYSANWSEYEDVPFWDMVDFIGIDAYFPLTNKNNPSMEELMVSWEDIAARIGLWLKNRNLDKGVIFTELGYVSSDGTNKQPWATLGNAEDEDEQALCFETAFTVLSTKPWFKGMYIWQYFPQERWSPLGFTIKDKKAEEVVKKWYTKL